MTARYDIVVIGGGINGTGVAQAAAAAGHSVLLLEKSTLGEGTSSRSSKLIHGGLRYLESMELWLVRESLHERTLMLKLAPDLMKLQRFHIPVYKTTRRRPWQLRIGLSLYATLGGFATGTGFGTLPRGDWPTLDGLRTKGLQEVFYYHDVQTDDRALTRAVMASAQELGAELAEHAEFAGATLGDRDAEVRYVAGGKEHSCTASVIVNAAGPWVADVLERIQPAADIRPIELIQGAHIIVPGTVSRGCYYMESRRDGRVVFVMPWKGQTLVGTTETRFTGSPDDAVALQSEKNYLGAILTYHFPRYREAIAAGHVESFAGLRVLPAGEGHAFHRSREVVLDTDRQQAPRMLSIYGGKLTTWRTTAKKILRRLSGSLPDRQAVADTAEIMLRSSD